MPCDKVFSWMVFAICNFSTHRITCYMHVYRRHKNRHLKAFFIEVFLFENLLDNHNFTVYWRKHFVGVWIEISRSEEHTSELQSRPHLVCRLLLEKKKVFYLFRKTDL